MLTTKNREWGFFGTARQQCGEAFAERAWRVAFEHVQNWMGWNDEMTRDFLDSKCGRFAEGEVALAKQADSLGVPIQKLEELRYVAEQTGASADTVTAALGGLKRGLSGNAPGYGCGRAGRSRWAY